MTPEEMNDRRVARERSAIAAAGVHAALRELIAAAQPSTEVEQAAQRLVRFAILGIQGAPADLLWLSEHAEQRRKRAWYEWVKAHVVSTTSFPGLLPDVIAHIARELEMFDANASTLTRAQVEKAFAKRTVSGVAARLAVECRALGYENSRTDYTRAKKLFDHFD